LTTEKPEWLSEAKLCVKIFKTFILDAKLRFPLLASLRSAILAKLKWTINWSLSPQGLKTTNFQQNKEIPSRGPHKATLKNSIKSKSGLFENNF